MRKHTNILATTQFYSLIIEIIPIDCDQFTLLRLRILGVHPSYSYIQFSNCFMQIQAFRMLS